MPIKSDQPPKGVTSPSTALDPSRQGQGRLGPSKRGKTFLPFLNCWCGVVPGLPEETRLIQNYCTFSRSLHPSAGEGTIELWSSHLMECRSAMRRKDTRRRGRPSSGAERKKPDAKDRTVRLHWCERSRKGNPVDPESTSVVAGGGGSCGGGTAKGQEAHPWGAGTF